MGTLRNLFGPALRGWSRNAKAVAALGLWGLCFLVMTAQTYIQPQWAYFNTLAGAPAAPFLAPTGGLPWTTGAANTNGAGANLTLIGGLGLGNAVPSSANGSIHFQTGNPGSSGVVQEAPTDRFILDTHPRYPQPTPPTVTAACGTSPTVVGSDAAFQLNVGTGGAATTCTITFNQPWAAKPVCIAIDETAQTAATLSLVPSTTTVVITSAAAWTASSILDVQCEGNQ